MIVEIDQSGKVEETARDTVIAFVDNGKKRNCRSILLPKKEKRKLQKFFREMDIPRNYVYQVFATLVFLLVRPYLHQLDRIIIDKEYPGKDALIRELITQKIKVLHPKFDSSTIVFQQVGKGSRAHDHAYYTYTKKYKPNIKVDYKKVLGIIVSPDK